MEKRGVMKSIQLTVFCITYLLLAPLSFGQTHSASSTDCDKLGPSTWKPGSVEEMHTQEASYWGCRMGVSPETVRQWQKASGAPDRIANIEIGAVDGHEFVFIERMGGTMRCFSFSALKKVGAGWEEVWTDAADEYCMMKCPGIEMKVFKSQLLLMTPRSSDPDCKQMFHRRGFFWDGKTFRPRAGRALPDNNVSRPK